MLGKPKRFIIGLLVLILTLGVVHLGLAQLEGLEGMDPPTDVSGMECTMCHGDFAQAFKQKHSPAEAGTCTICHLEKGDEGHGGLVSEDRALCLSCHPDNEWHYPIVNCWTSSCHSDVHGSDIDPVFNPSRQECYPGFFEATSCATYVGSETCLGCHCEKTEWWGETIHSISDTDCNAPLERKGCEGCHGPGGNHMGRKAGIGIFDLASVEESDTVCFKCHRDEMFEPDYWKTLHPLAGVACTNCHTPHNLKNIFNLAKPANELCFSCHKTKRADFNRMSSHPVDLKDPRSGMQCSDCHEPHGAEAASMLKAPMDELCMSCHVDKAGPFVYPHAGYDSMMSTGCGSCHTHHGSNSPSLLTMNGRGVCIQCHTDMVSHGSSRNCWTSGCHTEHHGSNQNFFFFN